MSNSTIDTTPVPPALRRWFVVHCVADWLFAVPLFFAPEAFLGALGWTVVDPATSRAVAAALVGIGTQSFLDRGAGVEVYRTMLSLKVLWSATACLGLAWTALGGGPRWPGGSSPSSWRFTRCGSTTRGSSGAGRWGRGGRRRGVKPDGRAVAC